MTTEKANEILLANACCMYSLCNKCPFKDTKDCRDISFIEVIDEAIDVVYEDIKRIIKKGEYQYEETKSS